MEKCFLANPINEIDEVVVARCPSCNGYNVWIHGEMVWPTLPTVPPSAYLPDDVLEAYDEAQTVIGISPRCACAMLRLALDRLAIHLGAAENQSLSSKIKSLPIPERYGPLAEACRVVGNDAVHEGALDYRSDDSYELARSLSLFVNLLADMLIGTPAKASEIIENANAAKAERKAERKAEAKSLYAKYASKGKR